MKRGTLILALLVSATLVACGSSSSDSTGDTSITWDTNQPDTAQPDTAQPDTTPEYTPAGEGKLAFVDQFGDDNKTCVQKDLCTFNVSFNAERSLRVLYTEDGAPVANVPLKFEVIEDPQAVGKMKVATVYSDTQGVASGIVQVVKAVPTTFKVKVTVIGAAEVTPIFFAVNASAKVNAFLTVSFSYAGARVFEGVKVYLFKNATTTAADILCADIDPLSLPTADLEQGPVQLTQTVKFEQLPGLEDESQQFYTVCARGEKADGSPVTFGCNDAEGLVSITSTRHVAIVLNDIAPRIAGAYEVHSELDLVSALPPNVEGPVNLVLNFFDRPSASLILLICQIDNATLQDLCGYVFADEDNPDVEALTAVGEIVLQLIDAYIEAYVEQWLGVDVFGIGEDIRDMLKELTLISTYEIQVEPGEDGVIPPASTSASWHSVKVRWTYGQDCPPNDENCGSVVFNAQSIGQNIVSAQFGATYLPQQGFGELSIGAHSLSLHYGALINYVLQKIVLPRVFGDGSDGKPVVDSYDKLIKSLLGGGKDCLDPSAPKSCCKTFAENVIAQAGDTVPESLLTNACESLITLGASYLEKTLTDLDLDTGKNLVLQTPEGLPCKVFDTNQSMKIDSWGKKEPKAERCEWDITLDVFGYQTEIDKNNFYGIEQQ